MRSTRFDLKWRALCEDLPESDEILITVMGRLYMERERERERETEREIDRERERERASPRRAKSDISKGGRASPSNSQPAKPISNR